MTGNQRQETAFWDIVHSLNELRLLPHLIIIGSWAEYLYEQSNYLPSFNANIRTKDVDVFVPNIRYPRDPVNLAHELEEKGFIVEIDYFTGVTKFVKEQLDLEFLARVVGAGAHTTLQVPSLGGIKVEGLRYLEILSRKTINVHVNDFEIIVPAPAAYILHKLTINRSDKNKEEKDMRAIAIMIDAIQTHIAQMELLREMLSELKPRQLQKIQKKAKQYGLELKAKPEY